MAEEKKVLSFERFASAADLPADEQALLQAALEATEQAYAPYSEFKVGAALLMADGSIITGNNQENLAYPSGLCAERVAFFHAGSLGKGKEIRKVAVRARSDRKPITEPVMPCGGCRQVMVEYEQMSPTPYIVLSQGESGEVLRLVGLQQNLLPFH
ncbi:MAG: cytidine deaminase, partial [Bacteroidota bacterium]